MTYKIPYDGILWNLGSFQLTFIWVLFKLILYFTLTSLWFSYWTNYVVCYIFKFSYSLSFHLWLTIEVIQWVLISVNVFFHSINLVSLCKELFFPLIQRTLIMAYWNIFMIFSLKYLLDNSSIWLNTGKPLLIVLPGCDFSVLGVFFVVVIIFWLFFVCFWYDEWFSIVYWTFYVLLYETTDFI